MRLSIDVTAEQHQKIKAVSALSGQSIKEYVLERVLPSDKSMRALDDFLEPRIIAAERGVVVEKSIEQIFKETYEKIR